MLWTRQHNRAGIQRAVTSPPTIATCEEAQRGLMRIAPKDVNALSRSFQSAMRSSFALVESQGLFAGGDKW